MRVLRGALISRIQLTIFNKRVVLCRRDSVGIKRKMTGSVASISIALEDNI